MTLILAGLDLATTSGLAVYNDGVFTATTFKANVAKKKKTFLERADESKAIEASVEGEIGRKFEDFLVTWLISNKVEMVAIEAPLPSNNSRQKTEINMDSKFAGQAITKRTVAGASMSSVFRMYGLEMIACSVCNRLNIPVRFIHQGTWRKSFLGNGRPNDAKKEAKKECDRRGIKVTSLDAAESVGVCFQLLMEVNPYAVSPSLFAPKKPLPKTPAQEDARAAADALFKKETETQ